MKHALVLLAAMSFAAPAFASKARLGSQLGAFDLVDVQNTFNYPAHIHKLSPLMTFEMGSTTPTGNLKAEGGFLMKRNDMKWGAYLGHASSTQELLRSQTTTYTKMENPVDLFFGKDNWAADVAVSDSEDKQADTKQSTVIGRFGMNLANGASLGAALEVYASANNAGQKYNGAPILTANYLQKKDEFAFEGGLLYGDTKQDAGATVSNKVKIAGLSASALHRPMPEIYYGASLTYVELDVEGKKNATRSLPVFFGIEKDVMSWLTVRGSVQQGLLLGSVKNDITSTAEKKNTHDTTVALGLGAKYNGFVLDGKVAGSTTGQVDGNNVLTNASVTYNF